MPHKPTPFSDEVFDRICERLAGGESLRRICKDPDMPSVSGVFKWLDETEKHPGLVERYARARKAQAEGYADEIVEIADTAHDRDSSAAAKVRADARKWVAAKLLPSKYGDLKRLEHSGPDGGPIQTTAVDLVEEADGE